MLTAISFLTAGLTWVITKVFDARRMEEKYRQLLDCEACMEDRKLQEGTVETVLEQVQKRLILGNLMLVRLWTKAGIPASEIELLEKSVGIKVKS